MGPPCPSILYPPLHVRKAEEQSRRRLKPLGGRRAYPSSVPQSADELRALLQVRVTRFGCVIALLAFTFLAIGGLATQFVELQGAGAREIFLAQAGNLVVGSFVWGVTRSGDRSIRTLQMMDCLATWGSCSPFLLLAPTVPIYLRPEIVATLFVTYILAARAFLVPSTPRFTAFVGSVAVVGLIVSSYVTYLSERPHPDSPSAVGYAVANGVLGLITLFVTTFTTRTVFGLRERAREALEFGNYTLLEKIGEGGMGIVYKARHATLRRPTAIKLLQPTRAGEHNLARFEREVQLTSQLTHPNTVAIYDYGRSKDGFLYYAMEYLDGLDLESLVEFAGPLDESRVVHVLSQICAALDEAHETGLIHRDIKPQNVVLCKRGGLPDVVKVVDFGLVKELDGGANPGTSAVDQIIGTPLYMSPEAITQPSTIDARTDLYAVGALGMFLLTGEPPFRGTTVLEICGHHLHTRPELPAVRLGREVCAELSQLIMACLEKDREHRPSSARELMERLKACEVAAWRREDAERWWTENAEAVALFKRRSRAPTQAAHTLPAVTLAVDPQARGEGGPWHRTPSMPPDEEAQNARG